jgi:hypothetical protein
MRSNNILGAKPFIPVRMTVHFDYDELIASISNDNQYVTRNFGFVRGGAASVFIKDTNTSTKFFWCVRKFFGNEDSPWTGEQITRFYDGDVYLGYARQTIEAWQVTDLPGGYIRFTTIFWPIGFAPNYINVTHVDVMFIPSWWPPEPPVKGYRFT